MANGPRITLKWAQTIDGQLADDRDQSQWISGPEERRYTHGVRARHDAVLVGAQTFLKDRCQLTVREAPLRGAQPARVILDPRGRIVEALAADPSLAAALSAGDRRTYVLTDILPDSFATEAAAQWVQYRFENFGQWLDDVLFSLGQRFARIEGRALENLMVEGGAATLALFLREKKVDAVEVAISPLILGGKKHRVFTGELLANVNRFRLESQERFGADVLLRYTA